MKELLKNFVFLIILIAVILAGSKFWVEKIKSDISQVKTTEKQNFFIGDWAEYHNEQANYKIYYPSYWNRLEKRNGDFHILRFEHARNDPELNRYLKFVTMEVETGPAWRPSSGEWKMVEKEDILIIQSVSAKEEFQKNIKNPAVRLVVKFKNQNKFYQIKYYYDIYKDKRDPKYEENFSRIIDGFQFLN